MRPDKLAGCGIAITRPAQQAQALAALIAAEGGQPVLFPLLEIVALQDYAAFDAQAATLDSFQWAFFISANAVAFGWQRLQHLGATFPPGLRCASIGPATAQALQQAGIRNILTPRQRYDSESLLASAALQDMRNQRCLIFRGAGGRELLAETLRERGAQVSFAECYRRINPSHDLTPLRRLWQNNQLQAIVLTSSEALRNLLALERNNDSEWLRQTRLFVNHERIAELAAKNGWQAIVAEQPGDRGMLAALVQNWKP